MTKERIFTPGSKREAPKNLSPSIPFSHSNKAGQLPHRLFLLAFKVMVVDIGSHLHRAVSHELRDGCQVSTVAEHGRREEMAQVVHPDRHLDPGKVTCGIEALPNRRHRLPPVLDDIRRLALVPHLAQALQKGRRYRDSPEGLRFGRVNPDRGLLEIHVLPAKGE